MFNRYFFRRGVAYILDLLFVAILISLLTLFSNSFFGTKFLAPTFIQSHSCEVKGDLISKEKVQKILNVEEGQAQGLFLCRHTNMIFDEYYSTTLIKSWKTGLGHNSIKIGYYSDVKGNKINYIPIDPLFYMLSPILFAFLLARSGATLGKRVLKLQVFDDQKEKPSFKNALKREFLKSIIFVIGSIITIYSIYQSVYADLETMAASAQDKLTFLQDNFFIGIILIVLLGVICIWYQFGSFIKWNGKAYWDRFTRLNVAKTADL